MVLKSAHMRTVSMHVFIVSKFSLFPKTPQLNIWSKGSFSVDVIEISELI